MSIVRLPSNQPAERFYRGGPKIRRFRGGDSLAAAGSHVPEDWVGSTTTLFGESQIGLTELVDGQRLRDAIEQDPIHWLGAAHVERFGADTMLLVKLLDAGQRLPVHIHPARDFSSTHLNRSHGKAEAWLILAGGTVHLGFNRDVGVEELEEWVAIQDTESMLEAMHAVSVSAGDTVLVPPGLPHAIGEGIFLVEVQEPEDLSILLEWEGFAIDGARSGHLGLGFGTALAAADRQGTSAEEIQLLIVRQGLGTATLAAGSEPYFRAEKWSVSSSIECDPGFSIVIVTAGFGEIQSTHGQTVEISRGDTLLVPHAAGSLQVTGELTFIRCRPPV
ncbi:hypothetical protein MB46_01500 [Arthrobacter alpinus]|uniref:class I mannose-6-phosphate isomerase n=1 Tax=Arthrobacter alpinus TaxID=656366 RepID=UPI0005CB7B0E|nr:class I mannose-6-phosphate isomerase [Arthrobacter alpinus]ALV44389.1 hypothetical protein MB46_01500 [Arthrobacter alpinus]